MLSIQNKIQSLILSKCVDPGNRMIGVEEESILYSNNGLRLPIKSSTAPNAKTITEILNKNKGLNGFYTMEPGGQVEWSSPPFGNLNELSSSMQNHNKLFESVVSKMQSKIIYFGLDPQFDPDSVELIDDQKYKIMDQKMKKIDGMGSWMMKNTASIQVNIDFLNLQDLEDMVFVADCLHPVASYLFANSPYKLTKGNQMKNLRNIIWHNTDIERCRNLFDHGITNKENLLEQYIEFFLNTPAIFETDLHKNVIGSNRKIGKILKNHNNSDIFSEQDILYLLRQIFTNVRIKNVVEVRGSDRPPRGFEISPAAFWTGVLTDIKTRNKILSICSKWTERERKIFNRCALSLDKNNIGPGGKPYFNWIKCFGDLALEGLANRKLGEEKFFDSFYNYVIKNEPFSLQTQDKKPTYSA